MRRHIPLTLAASIVAAAVCYLLTSAALAANGCNGFRWGDGGSGEGKCWTKADGAAFTRWLESHGSSAPKFRSNYPQLARTFGEKWGVPEPEPYWKTCVTGEACADAVLPRYFTNWQYAKAIVRCETGGTFSNRALGAAGERSWFQIHPVHFGWVDEDRLWDVRYSSSVAFRLSRGGTNWGPWTCSRYI